MATEPLRGRRACGFGFRTGIKPDEVRAWLASESPASANPHVGQSDRMDAVENHL